MTFLQIRSQQYTYHKRCKYSKDWNWKSPYTFLKSRFYMEGASIIVYLLQNLRINPNIITSFYGALGIFGGILLIKRAIPFAILIFFTKGILDLADGHYARITKQTSELGERLDYYAGRIGTIAFYIGLVIHIIRVNIYVLVYFLPLFFMHKLDGRARTIDFICLLLLFEILFT